MNATSQIPMKLSDFSNRTVSPTIAGTHWTSSQLAGYPASWLEVQCVPAIVGDTVRFEKSDNFIGICEVAFNVDPPVSK